MIVSSFFFVGEFEKYFHEVYTRIILEPFDSKVWNIESIFVILWKSKNKKII